MHRVPDFNYFLKLEDDVYPLTASLTVGRHLDNDVMVAGEDVLDFHLRVEPSERGARAYPLGEATLTVNGSDHNEAVGLVVGDHLSVGQTVLEFCVEAQMVPEAEEWWIHSDGDGAAYRVRDCVNVGRAEDNEVMLIDDHISRYHARFELAEGAVWLKDLGSANGTFLNGERVSGGCRLYHGDEVSFDVLGFQLIGKGAELTGVRRQPAPAEQAPLKVELDSEVDTTEIAPVEDEMAPLVVPASSETGAFLLGASDPVAGMTFRTRIGRTLIGRDEACDVVLSDRTVSARHAEIVVRPESCTVTNLMATNGTRVNGEQVQSAELRNGDVLRIGRVQLVYKDVPPPEGQQPWLERIQWILLGGSMLLALVLFWLLL